MLIAITGLPGSGKSTFGRSYFGADAHPNAGEAPSKIPVHPLPLAPRRLPSGAVALIQRAGNAIEPS